jgi:hypothetical protein
MALKVHFFAMLIITSAHNEPQNFQIGDLSSVNGKGQLGFDRASLFVSLV